MTDDNLSPESLAENAVYTLAASPDFGRDQICFAARATGLDRSNDGGLTWQDAYTALELQTPLPTVTVALSPNFTHDRSVFAGAPGGRRDYRLPDHRQTFPAVGL